MEKQLFSFLVVITCFGLNIAFLFVATSLSLSFYPLDKPGSTLVSEGAVAYSEIESLELSLFEREKEILDLKSEIAELERRLSNAQRMQQRTEKILASAKNELSVCASSGYSIDKGTIVTPSVAAPQKGHRFVEKVESAALNPSTYDWSNSPGFYEESVKKNPPQKSDMNTDITILIVCGNCTMRTKYPSESIDILNRWYPVEKVYLDGPNDLAGSSKMMEGVGNVKTRYVFVVDASVEFTHNTNLPRMKSMLDSQQVRAVSPMLENAATSELSGQCFDVRYHSHELRIRRGYAGVFGGNHVLCERGAPYFMTNKETLKQMWPSERLPLTLAVEAFYLQLKSFEMKVGFCPGSILRFNSIEAYSPSREEDIESCNVFRQPIAKLDELSKKTFAAKFHVGCLVYPDGSKAYLPEPVYELFDLSYTYHPASYYHEQREMMMASSSILQQSGIPAFLMDDDLMAAVLLGMPFPWADNIQLHILGR